MSPCGGRSHAVPWGRVLALLTVFGSVAGPVDSGPAELGEAYAKHLRATQGILDIRTFHRSAAGPNGLDVVVVSAGFTAAEKDTFHRTCEAFTSSLFSVQPWRRYRDVVNVHAVFVGDESVDSTRVKVAGYKGQVLTL
jgi:hypothetical protein